MEYSAYTRVGNGKEMFPYTNLLSTIDYRLSTIDYLIAIA